MKKTVAGLVLGLILMPSFAFAQTEPQPDVQATISALHQQLIELLQAQVAVLVAQLEDIKKGQEELKTETARIAEKVDKEEQEDERGNSEPTCEEEVTMEITPSRTSFTALDDGMYFIVELESKCNAIVDQKFVMDSPNQYDMKGVPNDSVNRNDNKKAIMRLSFYRGGLEPGVYPIVFTTDDEREVIEITIK